jgi:cell division protein FtsN
MGIAVDTTQQQPYDPIAALTKYLNQRNKPTAQEQKEKLTPEQQLLEYRNLLTRLEEYPKLNSFMNDKLTI